MNDSDSYSTAVMPLNLWTGKKYIVLSCRAFFAKWFLTRVSVPVGISVHASNPDIIFLSFLFEIKGD